MTKKIIIWAIVLVILGIAIYYFFFRDSGDDLESYLKKPTAHIQTEREKIDYVYNFLKLAEGGYSNLANDSGGETYGGISRKFHPTWSGWKFIDQIKATKGPIAWKTVFPELATPHKQFFINVYWKPFNLNYISDVRIALLAADSLWGSHRTALTAAVQEIYGATLTVYQLLTPSNIETYLNKPTDKDAFINKVLSIRRARYEASGTGKNSEFAAGWQNRLTNLKNEIFS